MAATIRLYVSAHLPQIAAMADAHFLIEKQSRTNPRFQGCHRLSDKDSVSELARMLGGAKITDTVMESAREMKALCHGEKSTIINIMWKVSRSSLVAVYAMMKNT